MRKSKLVRIVSYILWYFLGLATAASQTPTWQSLGGPMGTKNVQAIGQDPDGHVFISTFFPDTVYRSSDDGLSWEATSLVGREVYAFAASKSGSIFAAAWDAILKSSDHGIHWEVVSTGIDSLKASTICYSPQNVIFVGGSYKGILKSSDDGKSWSSAGLVGESSIEALVSDTEGTLLAATYSHGVYRSTDNGASWLKVDSLPFLLTSFTVNSRNEIFAGNSGGFIHRSSDGGVTWSTVSHGLPERTTFDPILGCTKGDTLFVGSFQYGVYRSIDDGANGTRSKSFGGYAIVKALLCTQRGSILIGTDKAGIFRTSDGGSAWRSVGEGLGRLLVEGIATDAVGDILAGSDIGMYVSTDEGKSWKNTVGVDTALAPYGIYTLAMDQEQRLFVGAFGGIFRSTDLGGSWSREYVKDPIQATITPHNTVLFLSSYLSVPDAYRYGNIYRSTDEGSTWSNVYQYSGDYLISMACGPGGEVYATTTTTVFRSIDDGLTWKIAGLTGVRGGNHMVVSSQGHVIIGMSDRLLKSADSGRTWQSFAGLGTAINVFLRTQSGLLFAATQDRGIFLSSDDGSTWKQVNDGLTDLTISALALDKDGNLICGTLSHGIFRTVQPVVSATESKIRPSCFELGQNYPNPFNPTTNFRFRIVDFGLVSLKVFDVLGREVTTLVNEVRAPGSYTVRWDGSGQPSGVYFYRLQAQGFVETKKMVLQK
jgi:photosystem II stability/assembly factor-like uncharacterized protein